MTHIVTFWPTDLRKNNKKRGTFRVWTRIDEMKTASSVTPHPAKHAKQVG